MKIFILFIFVFTIACNNPNSKHLDKNSITNKINSNTDSLHLYDSMLIDSLYNDVILIKSLSVDSFDYTYKQNKNNGEIEVSFSASVNKQCFGYTIILADTADNYNEEDFEPSNAFKYIASKLFLDKTIVDISKLKYVNESSVVEPVIVWYGKSFGIAAKYYGLPDRDVYLIRGLNFFCNGSNCMNYKILLLQKSKKTGNVSVSAFNFPGNYPYSFETTFLFRTKTDSIPKLFLVKEGKTGTKLSDFQMVNIE